MATSGPMPFYTLVEATHVVIELGLSFPLPAATPFSLDA